jgi:hypothetical protein
MPRSVALKAATLYRQDDDVFDASYRGDASGTETSASRNLVAGTSATSSAATSSSSAASSSQEYTTANSKCCKFANDLLPAEGNTQLEDEAIVCKCEQVTLGAIKDAARNANHDMNQIKVRRLDAARNANHDMNQIKV